MRRSSISAVPLLTALGLLGLVASCGDDDDDGPNFGALCRSACDKLNECQDILQKETCVASTYVPPCEKRLKDKQEAFENELSCLDDNACADIPLKCYGTQDKCAGVACDDPTPICNPDSGECGEKECTPNSQDDECDGDQFCWKAFCVDVYPRTYFATFNDVEVASTRGNDGETPWDDDGTGPDLFAVVLVNDKVVAKSKALEDEFESSDFDDDVEGGAKLEFRIDQGDELSVAFRDEDGEEDDEVFRCTIGDLAGTLRTPGLNCADGDEPNLHFRVGFEPD